MPLGSPLQQHSLYGSDPLSQRRKQKRGINVYHMSQVVEATGRDKYGEISHGTFEQPWIGLSIDERIDIFRKTDIIFGVVTSRMNRISALDYVIVPNSYNEDKIVENLKNYKSIFNEYRGVEDIKYRTIRFRMKELIKKELPDVLPDLSNFSSALVRWRRRNNTNKRISASEIEDWLQQPNPMTEWDSFVKQWVFDHHIHGSTAIYKEKNNDGLVENLFVLPGGTVFPFRAEFISNVSAYIQIAANYEPQIFFSDEVVYDPYATTSSWHYGVLPLDSLVNKISETLLFDQLMASQADGTKPPEKLVVFGESNPFNMEDEMSLPLDPNDQQRIETKLTEVKKHAIETLSGYGKPMVLDLTRENTMGIQTERQREIRKSVAIVFNMSNMEINESGGEGTSGRSTSESQEKIEKAKGTFPIIRSLQNKFNNEIIPYRFGSGFKLELQSGIDELEQIKLWKQKFDSGLFSVNEIRTQDMNEEPFVGNEFELPKSQIPNAPVM